jgi:hypothetical protein
MDELGPLVAAKEVERPSPLCPLVERVEEILHLLEAEAHEPLEEKVEVEGPGARAEVVEA